MKILMLTTVYPRLDSPKNTSATRVIQHFTESWQQMGHEVVVIHTVNKLFPLIYFLPESVKRLIKSRTTYEVSDYSIVCEKAYKINGIPVFRKPLFKWIPRGLTSARTIRRCARSIADDLQKVGFVPDVILGHWASPSAQLLSELKSYFPAPNALVFHSIHYARMYPQVLKACIRRIDRIGCRSETLAKAVKQRLELAEMPFVCYSGIPDAAAAQEFTRCFDGCVSRFLYVGELIVRKNADTILEALSRFMDRAWTLDIVGSGNERDALEEKAAALGIAGRVRFHGRIPREDVFHLMHEADVFTMVSRDEAFGLVYLEAMIEGCITVGSVREGIDGIIHHGQNGFLCAAGNPDELAQIYRSIFDMTKDERAAMSRLAYQTARELSNSAVAGQYLRDVLGDAAV